MKYEILAKGIEYTDKKTGEIKQPWERCGIGGVSKSGNTWINLKVLPVNFDGFLLMKEITGKKDDSQENIQSDLDDDIPF